MISCILKKQIWRDGIQTMGYRKEAQMNPLSYVTPKQYQDLNALCWYHLK